MHNVVFSFLSANKPISHRGQPHGVTLKDFELFPIQHMVISLLVFVLFFQTRCVFCFSLCFFLHSFPIFYSLTKMVDVMNTSNSSALCVMSFPAYNANVMPDSGCDTLPIASVSVGTHETNSLTQVIILGLQLVCQFSIHLTVFTSKSVSIYTAL